MKSKIWFILSMLVVIAMLGAACAPAATATTSAPQVVRETVVVKETVMGPTAVPPTAAPPAEIRPVVFIGGMGGDTGVVYQQQVDQWNAAHPELPVQFQDMQHEDLKQGIRALLLTNKGPDIIFWSAGNRGRFFAEKGLLSDLSDMFAPGVDTGDKTAGSFKALATLDGKQWLVPESYHWWSIWFKPEVFKANNVTPPQTFDELLAACDTFNANGIIPIAIGNRYKWPAAGWFDYISMRINTPDFHKDITDLKVSFEDPKVKKVFEYWNKLIDHKCFMKDSAAYDWQEAVPFLVQGKAAMYLMGSFILEEIPDDQEAQFDFFRFPTIDPTVPRGEDAPTDAFIIPKNASNPEGAKIFLAWLTGKEAQQYRLQKLSRLPTRTDVDLTSLTKFAQKGIADVQSADYVTMFYDRETTPEFGEKGMDAFIKFMDNPASIDQILKDLETARQEYLKTIQ